MFVYGVNDFKGEDVWFYDTMVDILISLHAHSFDPHYVWLVSCSCSGRFVSQVDATHNQTTSPQGDNYDQINSLYKFIRMYNVKIHLETRV